MTSLWTRCVGVLVASGLVGLAVQMVRAQWRTTR